MPSKQFLQQVIGYIRSKEARIYVEKELQHHLTQAKQAWMEKGYSELEAEEKAVAEMGSAGQLGKSLNKIHRPKWDFWLIGAMILLIAASFIPILTTDFTKYLGTDMTHFFVIRKIIHIVLAFTMITVMIYLDYRKLERHSMLLYGIAIVLLMVITFMPNQTVYGEAMLDLGMIRIQGWTILPLLLVAFCGFFANNTLKIWQLVLLFIVPLYFFFILPNLLVAVFYVLVIAMAFGFSAYSRKKKITIFTIALTIGLAITGFVVYAYMYLLATYQTERFKAFLHPELYADGAGYLILHLKSVLAQAGWFGAKSQSVVPQAHTDFALVQLIQAYGYIAGIIVIVIMLAVMVRIVWVVRAMPKSFGKLLVIAAVTLYSSQSLYSICMVFGLLPLTGVPLPFISYGATPMLLNALLIGLVLSVYRRKSYMEQHIYNS